VVGTFSSPKLRHEGANCEVGTTNGSLGRLAQVVLEFAARQLDGIEVGRVLRQIVQCRPRFLDRILDAGDLVGCEVVHHDNVAALERGNQALLDVSAKQLSAHGPLEHHWCGQLL
jgi:hypothetical protein